MKQVTAKLRLVSAEVRRITTSVSLSPRRRLIARWIGLSRIAFASSRIMVS